MLCYAFSLLHKLPCYVLGRPVLFSYILCWVVLLFISSSLPATVFYVLVSARFVVLGYAAVFFRTKSFPRGYRPFSIFPRALRESPQHCINTGIFALASYSGSIAFDGSCAEVIPRGISLNNCCIVISNVENYIRFSQCVMIVTFQKPRQRWNRKLCLHI